MRRKKRHSREFLQAVARIVGHMDAADAWGVQIEYAPPKEFMADIRKGSFYVSKPLHDATITIELSGVRVNELTHTERL